MTSPQKRNQIEVRLEISHFDDITHDEISRRLGLKPSRVYIKGQPHSPLISLRSKENRWLFNLYDAAQPRPIIEQQLDALSQLVEVNPNAFTSLCTTYTCGIFCIVTIYKNLNESTPAVYLEERHVRLLNTLSALFDVDIHVRT